MNLLSHQGEPSARISRECGLDAGVQSKKVGLERNFIDAADDLTDLARGVLNSSDHIADITYLLPRGFSPQLCRIHHSCRTASPSYSR